MQTVKPVYLEHSFVFTMQTVKPVYFLAKFDTS